MNYAIFDFDGTIVDSMYMWRNITNTFLKCNGYPTVDSIEMLNSYSWGNSVLEVLKSKYQVDIDPSLFSNWVYNYAFNQYQNNIQLKSNILPFLKKLKNAGVKMCICSSTYREMIDVSLKHLNIDDFFEFTCHCPDFGKEKNEPDIFLHCMKKLGAKKTCEVAVFEDALYAAKTAKKSGFYVVGVYDFYEKNQNELCNICNEYITDFSQTSFKR